MFYPPGARRYFYVVFPKCVPHLYNNNIIYSCRFTVIVFHILRFKIFTFVETRSYRSRQLNLHILLCAKFVSKIVQCYSLGTTTIYIKINNPGFRRRHIIIIIIITIYREQVVRAMTPDRGPDTQ